MKFTKYQQIAGFVGYELGRITALGAWRYMCDLSPIPEKAVVDTIDEIVDSLEQPYEPPEIIEMENEAS